MPKLTTKHSSSSSSSSMAIGIGPYTLLFFGNNFALNPFLLDLAIKAGLLWTKDPTSPEHAELLIGIKTNVKVLAAAELLFFAAFLIGLFSAVRSKIYTPLFTWCFITICMVVYTVIGVAIISSFTWISSHSIFLATLGVLVVLCYHYYYLCVGTIWMMGLVISANENCYGASAMDLVGGIMRGRSVDGLSLTFKFTLAASGISLLLGFVMGDFDLNIAPRLTIGLILISITYRLSIASSKGLEGLYYICKMSGGEQVHVQAEADLQMQEVKDQ